MLVLAGFAFAQHSDLSSFVLPDGPHLTYVDINQHVDQVFYGTSTNTWYVNDLTAASGSLTAAPGSAMTSFVLSDGPHVVFVDANQHVDQIFYVASSNTWYTNDLWRGLL